MSAPIQLVVYGRAETQGSKTLMSRGGRSWVTEGTGEAPKRRKAWREAVAQAAREWQKDHGADLLTGPVTVSIRFFMEKPASAPKRRHTWPKGADVDKLARSCLDSLTHTLLANDSQVVAAALSKTYGDPPRVELAITPVPADVVEVRLSCDLLADRPALTEEAG